MGYGVNVPTINERFMQMNPQGYLTASDEALGERLSGRANEQISSNVARARADSALRFAQRGIGGAAAEQGQSDLEYGGGVARARAASGVADVMGELYRGNLGFERDRVMHAWDAELAAKTRSDERRQRSQAAWANAVGAALKGVGGFFGGGAAGAGAAGAGAGTPYEPVPYGDELYG